MPIGLVRELRDKSAGLRTHTVVSLGAALFMLISKYGFADLTSVRGVSLDPSRVAAQIVSGIGSLGAGVIFLQRDNVKGLTTAATIWLTAAVGAAAGAGLLPIVAVTTVLYLILAIGYRVVDNRPDARADRNRRRRQKTAERARPRRVTPVAVRICRCFSFLWVAAATWRGHVPTES